MTAQNFIKYTGYFQQFSIGNLDPEFLMALKSIQETNFVKNNKDVISK